MHAARSIRILCWIAALCFVAAWLLPAAPGMPGWVAFRQAFSAVWPYGGGDSRSVEDAAPQVLSALTNGVFVVLFGSLLVNRLPRPALFLRIAIACFVLNLYWIVQMLRDGAGRELRIGYYVWLAAFAALVVIGGILARGARPAPR